MKQVHLKLSGKLKLVSLTLLGMIIVFMLGSVSFLKSHHSREGNLWAFDQVRDSFQIEQVGLTSLEKNNMDIKARSLIGDNTAHSLRNMASSVTLYNKEPDTERKVTTDKKKYCKANSAKVIKLYGKSVDATVITQGNRLTAMNVHDNVKVAGVINYYSEDEKTMKIGKTEFAIPDASRNVVFEIPLRIQEGGVTYQAYMETAEIRYYPITTYEDDDTYCQDTWFVYYKDAEVVDNEEANSSYNQDFCVEYRNKYASVLAMRNAVSYCFKETVVRNFTEEEVKRMIQIAEASYALSQEVAANKKELPPDDENTVSDPNIGTLLCDSYVPDEFNEDGTIQKYANSKTYNYTKTTYEGEYCKTICKETVTINYQAPIATQAGLCFSYKVEVKSKVDCTMEQTKDQPVMGDVCVPRPSCWGEIDRDTDAGGPNEDFDACVEECDGGKYTQKCINKCYQKVYNDGARAKNMLSYYRVPQVSRLAKVTCPTGSTDKNKPKYGNMSYQEIYEFRKKYPGGYYKVLANGESEWVPGKNSDGTNATCPSYIGYYYFSTYEKTKSTIGSIRNQHVAKNGFKIKDSAVYACDATCTWKGSCDADSFMNTDVATDDFEKKNAAFEADMKKCQEAASCSETTTEYTITVDKDDKDSPNYKVYEATQKPGGSPHGDTIIEDYSGNCYTNASTSNEEGLEYRNVLSFPKTYLSVKTGLTTTLKPNNLNHFVYVGNSFCTSTKTNPVNVDWYNWKVYKEGDVSQLTDKEKASIASSRVDNINVEIGSSKNHLWGLMGWKFDIGCFYAIADPRACNDSGCLECSGESCGEKPIVQDYTFRTISLDDVFPPSKASPEGRSPRYNWTCQATNTLNEDYPVQPSATITSIESKGNSIYNSDAELDYEIDLTISDISKVREYNKTRNSYLDYEENAITSKVDGITVYTSSFLTKTLGDSLKKRGIAGCNNQKNGVCDNTVSQDECFNALK